MRGSEKWRVCNSLTSRKEGCSLVRSGVMSDKLISFEEGGKILNLHHTTIRQRKAGTEGLTHVRGFGRLVKLIEAEVLALRQQKIAESVKQHDERKSLLKLAS